MKLRIEQKKGTNRKLDQSFAIVSEPPGLPIKKNQVLIFDI